MTKITRVLWIDDDQERKADQAYIESKNKRLSITLLHPCLLENKVISVTDYLRQFSLFLVDYFLGQKPSTNDKVYLHKGLTIGAQIREQCPEYPIYLITQNTTEQQQARLEGATQAAESIFDRILIYDVLRTQGEKVLFHDANDYKAIREAQKGEYKVLFDLIKAPDETFERLDMILPDKLQKGISPIDNADNSKGNVIDFSNWVRNELLPLPGFLYNELYASTHFGMKKEYFKTISKYVTSAEYKGVFHETTEPLWWAASLDRLLFAKKRSQSVSETNTWKVAPVVFGVPDDQRAKCIVCGEPYPETVGMLKDNEHVEYPVHYKCSEPHPFKKRALFFDEPRVYIT